jgi:hypothetical protein
MSRYALAIFTRVPRYFSGGVMTSEIFSFNVRTTVAAHTRAGRQRDQTGFTKGKSGNFDERGTTNTAIGGEQSEE